MSNYWLDLDLKKGWFETIERMEKEDRTFDKRVGATKQDCIAGFNIDGYMGDGYQKLCVDEDALKTYQKILLSNDCCGGGTGLCENNLGLDKAIWRVSRGGCDK
jgi:hypothetical protein